MSVEIHDEWGCSRHDGLLKCLGYKSGPGGIAAQHGHQMHGMAETIIKSGWKPFKFPDLFETGKPFTQEHRSMVLDYCNAIRTQFQTYQKQYGAELELHVEHQIKIPNLGIEISTIDVLFYVPFNFIHIVDFKTGQKPVSPTSAQMRGYTLGSMDAGPAERFKASIFQPALSGEFLSCEFTLQELEAHEKMMKLVLHAAKREHAPCTPCEYCGWCARNGECPATKAQLAMIAIDCDKYDISQSTLAILTDYAMKIEDIIGSLKQRAYAILEAGGTLPLPDGRELMLVDGRPTRVWRSEKEAKATLIQLAQTKLGMADMAEIEKTIFEQKDPVMLSPSKAEGVFGKSKAVKALLDPLVFSKEGNKKLGVGKRAEQTEGETDHE